MLQQGRKSRSSREFLALIGQAPDQQPKAPVCDLPEPPSHFSDAERQTWDAILQENPHLTYGGGMLLSMAIHALHQADHCAEVIDKAGGPLSVDNRGRPKRHPLAGIEVANRKLAKDLLKMLRLNWRGESLGQFQ